MRYSCPSIFSVFQSDRIAPPDARSSVKKPESVIYGLLSGPKHRSLGLPERVAVTVGQHAVEASVHGQADWDYNPPL